MTDNLQTRLHKAVIEQDAELARLRARLAAAEQERDEARGGVDAKAMQMAGDAIRILTARLAAAQEEIGRIRTAFRVNMLRHVSGVTHAEIDALLAAPAATDRYSVPPSERVTLDGEDLLALANQRAAPAATDHIAEAGKKVATEGEKAERVRHKKRGSTYVVVGEAEIQCSGLIHEGDRLTVYRSEKNGKLWARPTKEFRDGRFEGLPEKGEGE